MHFGTVPLCRRTFPAAKCCGFRPSARRTAGEEKDNIEQNSKPQKEFWVKAHRWGDIEKKPTLKLKG
jgi:hypothetical protein